MLTSKEKVKISKFLSLILRHQPEVVGLKLEENGWISVDQLIKACVANGQKFSFADLKEIVETNDKKRFAFNEDETKIRASQGHSLEVEIEFEKRIPPKILYHGTAERNLGVIFAEGLKKMKRHHVHLTEIVEMALKVGVRYGKPVVLQIDTVAMRAEGMDFFVSANVVWLVESVPPKFLKTKE